MVSAKERKNKDKEMGVAMDVNFVENFGTRKEDEFIENNIRFRIISSKMLERYKNTQSFVLTEMLHGQYKFSRTSREIMLFSMDKWFKWLTDLERELIRDASNTFNEEILKDLLNKTVRTDSIIIGTIMSRPDVFNTEEAKLWMDARKNTILGWQFVLKSFLGRESSEAFSSISAFLVEAIESMKFSLYETDYLIHDGSTPFVCITNTCLHAKEDYGINILENKLTVYKDYFPDLNKIVVKNYSDAKYVETCLRSIESIKGMSFVMEEVGGIS